MTIQMVIDDLRSRLDEGGLDFDGSREVMLAILGENALFIHLSGFRIITSMYLNTLSL